MTNREEELSAALLWLRNQYDVGSRAAAIKHAVLKRVDWCLAEGPPIRGESVAAFREKYPSKGLDAAKRIV